MLNLRHRALVTCQRFCSTTAVAAPTTTAFPQIEATMRSTSDTGSRKSRVLREAKLVPGVVYGKDADGNVFKANVTVPLKDIMRELREKKSSFENTVYEMVIKTAAKEGEAESIVSKHLVTPRQTQFNPVTDLPVSVNFLNYGPGSRVRIPVEYINEDQSQDMRRGCFLVRVNNFVECVCDEAVPARITVDLANAKKGDVYRLNTVGLPPKVRPSRSVTLDYVLGVVQASKS